MKTTLFFRTFETQANKAQRLAQVAQEDNASDCFENIHCTIPSGFCDDDMIIVAKLFNWYRVANDNIQCDAGRCMYNVTITIVDYISGYGQSLLSVLTSECLHLSEL